MARNVNKAIADICDGAYDVIDTEGWWDGRGADGFCYGRGADGFCIVTAVRKACAERKLYWAMTAALDAIRAATGDWSIPHWQDRQTEYTVLRKLEEVADAHRF